VNGHASSGPCEPRTERDGDGGDHHYRAKNLNRKALFSRNKYRRWYDALMAHGYNRLRFPDCEGHHILPRSFGGNNNESNIAFLTYQEHFIAHWLLPKFTTGNARRKMLHALTRMTHRDKKRIIVSGWQYAVAARAKSEASKGNTYAKGYRHSAETCAKISAAHKGKTISAEARAKISAAHKGNTNSRGNRHTAETCAKISAAHKGRTHSAEARANMSAAHKGSTNSKGYRHTAEALAKMSAAARGNTNLKGYRHTAEARAKISAALKRHFRTAEIGSAA
jgi:hypothetical protein